MNSNRGLAAIVTSAVLLATVTLGIVGAVTLRQRQSAGPADPAQNIGGPAVVAAAMRAAAGGEGAPMVYLPRWHHATRSGRQSSAIVVMNVGSDDVKATITFRTAAGEIADCGDECVAALGPGEGHLFWPPAMKALADLPDITGSALVTGNGQLVAAVVDLSLTDAVDATSYLGIAAGSDVVPAPLARLPLALRGAPDGLGGVGDSTLAVQNIDASLLATIVASFYNQDGSSPIDVMGIAPAGESALFYLPGIATLPDGAYAVHVAADHGIALLAETAVAKNGDRVWQRESAPGVRLIAPLVFKNDRRRCSIVTLQNTDLTNRLSLGLTLNVMGTGGPPVLSTDVVIPRGTSLSLDLCADQAFEAIPDGFAGSLVASGQAPVAGSVMIDTVTTKALAGYEAVPAGNASSRQFVPLVGAGWVPEPGGAEIPLLDTLLIVHNPNTAATEARILYRGIDGPCAGKATSQDPKPIPGGASVVFDPGPDGDAVLPAGCLAAAVVEAVDGEVIAIAYDEGQFQPATATPTDRPAVTPAASDTPVATDTPRPTDVPSDTPTARQPTTPSPTPTITLSLTPRSSPTASPTVPAQSTRRPSLTPPPTSTVPRATARPPVPTVPARSWTRVRPDNSLLPYDRVRHLEIDRQGRTWMRLINPRGGPDTVVVVNLADRLGRVEWEVYTGGMEAVAAMKARGTFDGLESLRDFFEVDGRGRLWSGPAYQDLASGRWHRLAVDDGSPAGGTHFEGRTLLDGEGQAWAPYAGQLDCPPPGDCRTVGVRGFSDAGRTVADLVVPPAPEAAQYGVDRLQLVSTRHRRTGAATTGRIGGDVPAGAAQLGAIDAWLVAPSVYYAPPDTTARYYPYLDPRAFLDTGLRNAGYATAAGVTPGGRLQVITWVELDRGNAVEHHIFLNTLAADGTWQADDLGGSPLLAGRDLATERIVAMEYCPDGELWLATAAGAIGVRRDGERRDGAWSLYPLESGVITPGTVITDLGCAPDGTIWVGTRSGLVGYGFDKPPVRIYAPSVVRRR